MFSSKKGDVALEESQQNLLSLVFALGIFIGIMSFIFAIKSGTVFERHFHVKEMALLVDAVTISPGAIEVDYPKDMKDLGLIFEKEKITVYKLPKFISPPEHYPFSEDKNVIYEYIEIEPPGKGTIRPKISKQEMS